jgi:uncharacterized NAD-dependent epimerase/dehydratase family protein
MPVARYSVAAPDIRNPRAMDIKPPYLMFLGDVPDQLAAKTAQGIVDWRPEWCLGQLRLPGCGADLGIAGMTVADAAAAGAKTMIVGVANAGGVLPPHWSATIIAAMTAGMDVASGLHAQLESVPEIRAAAARYGRALFNVRHTDRTFATGKGTKREGYRLLTVGTDCSVGKKYTVLALEKEMRGRGLDADFCATGQTGVFISGRRGRGFHLGSRGMAVARCSTRPLASRRGTGLAVPPVLRRRDAGTAARCPARRLRGLP